MRFVYLLLLILPRSFQLYALLLLILTVILSYLESILAFILIPSLLLLLAPKCVVPPGCSADKGV